MTFPAFIRTCGILPPEYIIPGRWIRCATEDHPRSRNGAIKLSADGVIGWCQNHATMTEVAEWRNGAETPLILSGDVKAARDARRRTDRDGRASAYFRWRACQPLRGGHPYLAAKRISMEGCFGLASEDEKLIVPLYLDNKITSLQSIEPDGSKLFHPGAPASGGHYFITRPESTIMVLAEGLATGLTVFQACKQSMVVIAFNCANMPKVARLVHWNGLCVVAADNDTETAVRIGRNPGLDAAREAAAIIGCGLAVPVVKEGSDFNDLYLERLDKLELDNLIAKIKRSPEKLMAMALASIGVQILREATKVARNPLNPDHELNPSPIPSL